MANQARALWYLGRATDALLGELPDVYRAHLANRALVLSLLGRCDESIAIRGRFAGIESSSDETAVHWLTLLFEAAIRCGDNGTVEVLLHRLSVVADQVSGWLLVSFGRLLGEAAVLVGRRDQAMNYFEKALDICRQLRFRPELALTRLDVAELLSRQADTIPPEVLEHIDFAIAEFESMHMQPHLQRALELRRVVVSAVRDATTTSDLRRPATDPLTPREWEVAALVARGLSNREIADTLVITEGTAEVHVKHMLSKLGFKSRSQIAAWFAESGRLTYLGRSGFHPSATHSLIATNGIFVVHPERARSKLGSTRRMRRNQRNSRRSSSSQNARCAPSTH